MAHDISEQKHAERFLIAQRDLAGFLSQTYDLSAALKRLIDTALQIPGVDCGGVYLLEPQTGGFELKAHHGLSREFVEATAFYSADSAGARLLDQGQPLYTLPPALAQPLARPLEAAGVLALAVVPLIDEGRLVGSFNFGSHTCAEFPPSSRMAVEALAALVVGAIARIQAEQQFRDGEARLRAFLENSAVIAWMKDEEGRHEFLSDNYRQRFQLRFDDWKGKTDFELWPRDIAEGFRRNDLAVLETGRSLEVIEQAIDPDRSSSWWLNSKFLFRDSSGRRHVGGLGCAG